MKLSLAPLVSVLSLSLSASVVGCGSSSSDPAPAPVAEVPTETPVEPAPKPRTLIEATVQPTSPVNLLADPGFALVAAGASYTSFLAFEEATSSPFDIETTLDSRSPAGFAGGTALVRPSGATDTKSDAVILLTSILGGQGPFRAQVWFSKSDAKGKPATLATDGSAVSASLTEESPEGKGYDLAPVPEATRTVSGRTWVLYRAEIASPLPYGGFMVIRTGDKGGQVQIAAPEVTTAEIVAGAAVRARSATPARARGTTSWERAAIRRFRSIKPVLTPAGFRTGR